MNKIKTSLLLLCVLLSAKGFEAAAKKAPKTLISEVKSEAPCRCNKDKKHHGHHLLGKPFTKSQVTYGSLKENQVYVVEQENDVFIAYKKGKLDKEGISNEDMVSIFTPAEETK